MSLVSNAVQQERELAEQDKKRKDELIARTQKNAGQQSGPVSLLNGGGGKHAPIPVPGKKGP